MRRAISRAVPRSPWVGSGREATSRAGEPADAGSSATTAPAGMSSVRAAGDDDGGLHLAEFDAVAADFHLVVGAAEVVECVAIPAHRIAGAVKNVTRDERARDESLRSQSGRRW